jgi:phosphatidylserine synthase
MKLKDYCTLGNLLGGFAAVVALFHDRFDWACYLIYIAYVFDVLDGPVARLTRQHDKFGGLFDSVCDYITNSIAVSFIIYYAFWKLAGYPWLLAAGIAAFPFSFGTIRQARGMERDLSYPCYWIGLPRPVLAIFILAVLNSSLFNFPSSPWRELGQGLTAGFVVIGSILHLSHLPFVNHHERRWMKWLWFGMHFFLAGTPIAFLVSWLVFKRPSLVYNYLLLCLVAYLFVSWTQIPKEDLRRIRAYIRGEPLVKPLVHRDSTWQATAADYFLSDRILERQAREGSGPTEASPAEPIGPAS